MERAFGLFHRALLPLPSEIFTRALLIYFYTRVKNQSMDAQGTYTAFDGTTRLFRGTFQEVVLEVKERSNRWGAI